jgi:transcriptional regulator with XRE-family HTH domain
MALGETLRSARLERGLSPSEVAAATRMKVQIVEGIEREDFSKIAAPIYGKGFIRLYAEAVGVDPEPLIAEYTAMLEGTPPPHAAAPAAAAHRAVPRNTTLFPLPDTATVRPESEPDTPEHAGPVSDPPAAELPWETPPDASPSRAHRSGARLRALAAQAAQAARDRCDGVGALAGQALRRSAARLEARCATLRTARLSETPIRYASLLVGIVLVLLFVLSGLSRCARLPLDDTLAPAASEDTLELVIDPPMPYLD